MENPHIMNTTKSFHIKKTFGLGVLMKLTKKNVEGIEITTVGDQFVSNVSRNTLKNAVENTIAKHNIQVRP